MAVPHLAPRLVVVNDHGFKTPTNHGFDVDLDPRSVATGLGLDIIEL